MSYAENYSIGAGSPVIYDATTRTFTFRNVDYLIPADRRSSVTFTYDPAASTTSFTEYRASSKGVSYLFTEVSKSPGNPTLQLEYCGLAIIRSMYFDGTDGLTKYAVTSISYGILYEWDKSKLAGSASYNGVLLGHARGVGSRVYDVRGTVKLNVNYDSTSFDGTIYLTGTDDRTGRVFDLGTLAITSLRPRGVLDYLYGSTPFDGRLQASLAGARGEELTGGFDAMIADPQTNGINMKLSVAFAAKK